MKTTEVTPGTPLPPKAGKNKDLQVFIHPFFGAHPARGEVHSAAQSMARLIEGGYTKPEYYKGLLRALRSQDNAILIGEEEPNIDITLRLLEILRIHCPVYYFVTYPDQPVPKKGGYVPLIHSIEAYEPSSMIVGGQLLQLDPNSQAKRVVVADRSSIPLPSQDLKKCVGTFALKSRHFLPSEIPVTLSPHTWPHRVD